jgi:hypothetical protein
MSDLREILKILRHNFYLYYRSFGMYDKSTQCAYDEWHKQALEIWKGDMEDGKRI